MSDYLPEDILLNILARLPVKTLLQFRCVSKTWYSLITSPSFITHHLNEKATSKNNDFLLFKNRNRYFLYPDKDFLTCNGEEIDFPLHEGVDFPSHDNMYNTASCNGVSCLVCFYFDSRFKFWAALWNPSIRKTVPIPRPNVSFQSRRLFEIAGFGFDSINHDYKLVRIVYLATSVYYHTKKTNLKLPPLAEVYSLKSGCWRMVENDLKHVIMEYSRSAFVNGACHWTTVSSQRRSRSAALNVIVVFDLADEKMREMIVPDCIVFRDDMELTVTVFDGLLSLVASWTRIYGEGSYSIWQMKEYGDAKSWTKLFNIEHMVDYVYDFVGFKKNGEVFLVVGGQLTSYSRTKNGSCRILGTKIWGSEGTFYLDSYVESLVLLNEASWIPTDNPSPGNNEASRVSKEHSSHVADLDKKKKKKKGKKNLESPEIVDEENRVLEGDGCSSSTISRNVVTNEGNGASKERDFGAKNRKQKEKNKNGKNNMDSDDELPGKNNSCASADTAEKEAHEAAKELAPSSGSNADKKKGTKKKKGKHNKNE